MLGSHRGRRKIESDLQYVFLKHCLRFQQGSSLGRRRGRKEQHYCHHHQQREQESGRKEKESFNDEQNHSSSVKIIGASTPGKSMKTSFAVENAAKFLKIYENYYSIPYPLPKLHLIALPEYAAGAMENWGAITFREAALLVDENSSVMNKRNVARVVGHEVAHQWFGNLVTMKWWNDLWLNESFATFLETKMADKLYPEWKNWNDFLMYDTSPAMEGDSLQNTHPIQVEVRSPDEISGIFDEISYG